MWHRLSRCTVVTVRPAHQSTLEIVCRTGTLPVDSTSSRQGSSCPAGRLTRGPMTTGRRQ